MTVSDGYVRISIAELSHLQLHHITSEVDLSIGIPPGVSLLRGQPADNVITGYTEWTGAWREQGVTLAWDWGIIGNLIFTLSPDEIRTNLRIVNEWGQDTPPMLGRVYILDYIEQVPWRELIAQLASVRK
jgi:hypothetical protein